jgi:hypothetical protein
VRFAIPSNELDYVNSAPNYNNLGLDYDSYDPEYVTAGVDYERNSYGNPLALHNSPNIFAVSSSPYDTVNLGSLGHTIDKRSAEASSGAEAKSTASSSGQNAAGSFPSTPGVPSMAVNYPGLYPSYYGAAYPNNYMIPYGTSLSPSGASGLTALNPSGATGSSIVKIPDHVQWTAASSGSQVPANPAGSSYLTRPFAAPYLASQTAAYPISQTAPYANSQTAPYLNSQTAPYPNRQTAPYATSEAAPYPISHSLYYPNSHIAPYPNSNFAPNPASQIVSIPTSQTAPSYPTSHISSHLNSQISPYPNINAARYITSHTAPYPNSQTSPYPTSHGAPSPTSPISFPYNGRLFEPSQAGAQFINRFAPYPARLASQYPAGQPWS